MQLFQWLRDQYPHSPLRANASAEIEQIQARSSLGEPPPSPDSTIRAVHREVLPEVVRITVELDKEVPFYQERIDGPSRLFFDLKGTKTVPALVDAMFRYDSDVVRHIRLGPASQQHYPHRAGPGERGALQRLHALHTVSHRH